MVKFHGFLVALCWSVVGEGGGKWLCRGSSWGVRVKVGDPLSKFLGEVWWRVALWWRVLREVMAGGTVVNCPWGRWWQGGLWWSVLGEGGGRWHCHEVPWGRWW